MILNLMTCIHSFFPHRCARSGAREHKHKPPPPKHKKGHKKGHSAGSKVKLGSGSSSDSNAVMHIFKDKIDCIPEGLYGQCTVTTDYYSDCANQDTGADGATNGIGLSNVGACLATGYQVKTGLYICNGGPCQSTFQDSTYYCTCSWTCTDTQNGEYGPVQIDGCQEVDKR